MTFEEKYYIKLKRLPEIHPLHPYTIYLSNRHGLSNSVIVSATSPERAELGGIYYAGLFQKPRIKYDNVRSVPLVPIEKNLYWDKVNIAANPLGKRLSTYKKVYL